KWQRQTHEKFSDNNYSRAHQWKFDGGQTIQASASPHVVPLPYSVAANVDPEEAFVAALSSCHMLFFLSIAAKRRYVIESYSDYAYGIMQLDNDNKMSMTDVTLKPQIVFVADKKPTKEQIDKIHQQAHKQCFIANSVKTKIHIEPKYPI
ncbi:MAG TPA: OsmC family peroxiredoxin, partial [Oceanospirillales bacterium]|nr:OsmC family peroxiredoxin [Oceanospirillales bacterium]